MKNFFLTIIWLLSLFVFLPTTFVLAQDQIKLTITPPMIRNNVNPGQIWRSSVKLVNNNSKEIDIYVRLNDFKGGQDDGTVEFIPSLKKTEGEESLFLSQWIDIEKGPIRIEPYKSVDIPFSIRVPEKAEPGGHYAAILAGTQPDQIDEQGSAMKVSSLLASLILLNVQGDVEEQGMIREFSTSHKYYGDEEVNFVVRFENLGNVHIQPQGEIRIYNMWGKDRGAISINQGSVFGNVLPEDIRKWNFQWQADNSFLEMGRYKAVLVLGFGNQARQTVDQTIFFWVIFLKPLLIALSSIIATIILLFVSIKLYIKRAILKTQKEAGFIPPVNQVTGKSFKIMPNNTTVVNLKQTGKTSESEIISSLPLGQSQAKRVKWAFFRNYSRVMIIVLLIILGGISYIYYQRNYNVKKVSVNNELTQAVATPKEPKVEVLTTEEAKKEIASSTVEDNKQNVLETSTKEAEKIIDKVIDNDAFYIRIANGSGYVGAASDIDKVLYAAGYKADELGNADNFNYQITLIKYLKDFEKEAEDISRIIETQVEMQEVENQKEDILVIVGKNIR